MTDIQSLNAAWERLKLPRSRNPEVVLAGAGRANLAPTVLPLDKRQPVPAVLVRPWLACAFDKVTGMIVGVEVCVERTTHDVAAMVSALSRDVGDVEIAYERLDIMVVVTDEVQNVQG